MSNREPAQTNIRGRLTAKRELVIEAVRVWAEVEDTDLANRGLESRRSEIVRADLLEAWRDYREAEKKAGRGMGGAG